MLNPSALVEQGGEGRRQTGNGSDGKTKQRKREFSMSHLFCTTISN